MNDSFTTDSTNTLLSLSAEQSLQQSPTNPASTLLPGSTSPLFSSFFAGANFFSDVAPGGGVFATGVEAATNIFIFGDAAGENDVAAGGNEVDILMANAGDDNIMGAAGTDFVFGGLGDDIVRGGTGDDVVVGNEGSDVFVSGEGSDIYEFFADQFEPGDRDIILDFEEGSDALVIVGSTDASYDSITGLLSVDGVVVGSLGTGLDLDVLTRTDSTVLFSSEADLSGFGTALATMPGMSMPDSEEADSEEADLEDTSLESATTALADGSTPPLFSSFFAGASFFENPQPGGGIFVAGQEDATNLILFEDGTGSNDVAVGGNEVDIIMGEDGSDNIMGAAGTDFMFGGTDDDIVRGGAGDDVIVGNEGSDVLIGGSGSDIFEFFSEQFVAGELDVILDFELGQDSIVVVGSTDTNYDPLSGLLAVDGTDVAVLEAGLELTTTLRTGSSVLA
ncbi:MAG: calcium-binding protein [Cyanobacteria bacterium J06634_5]